jgi:hypothetical protein
LTGHICQNNAIETLEVLLRDSIEDFTDGLENAPWRSIVLVKFAQFNFLTITDAFFGQAHPKNLHDLAAVKTILAQ